MLVQPRGITVVTYRWNWWHWRVELRIGELIYLGDELIWQRWRWEPIPDEKTTSPP